MGEHGAKLGDGENLKERQPEPHHSAASKTHDPAPRGNPGIHVSYQVNLTRQLLAGVFGDICEDGEQLRIL